MILYDIQCTSRLAREICSLLQIPDIILLKGDLGVGKTTLASEIIRCLFRDPNLYVTSPTFPILQIYSLDDVFIRDGKLQSAEYNKVMNGHSDPEESRLNDKKNFKIYHFDLYRIKNPYEILELGLEEAFEQGICIIEWPEIIENIIQSMHYTEINIILKQNGERVAEVSYKNYSTSYSNA